MHRRTRTIAVQAVLLALALCAFPGTAQVFTEAPGNGILVSQTNPGADFDTIQPAIDAAVFRARSRQVHYTVWVESGTYDTPAGLWIPADADITVRGISPGVSTPAGSGPGSSPWQVIIDGAGITEGVINIHTGDAAALGQAYLWLAGGDADDLARLSIEGLTVRNGTYGVRVSGTTGTYNDGTTDIPLPPVQPTLSRMVILGTAPLASKAGVLVEGNAAPLIANCSIGGYKAAGPTTPAYNTRIGVHVSAPDDTTGGFFTDILHCTILLNEDFGVYVEEDADARVRNSIVYRNGDDDTTLHPLGATAPDGGIVWEADPFINPRVAPYNTDPTNAVSRVPVTISGTGLVDTSPGARPTLVFFGPMDFSFYRAKPGVLGNPDLPDWPTDVMGDKQVPLTLWYPAVSGSYELVENADGTQSLSGLVPPSYLNGPGTVDVTILRGDGFVQTVRAAFTYTWDAAADGATPEVFAVSPERGPAFTANTIDITERRGMWVHVHGARFEPDCEVYFDTTDGTNLTPNRVLDINTAPVLSDAKSERVQWLSPTTLYCKVPEVPAGFTLPSGKIDVFVRNVATAQSSTAGQTREFEFLDPASNPYYEGVRPAIAQISPNFYRDLDASDQAEPVRIHIVGWNFGPGPNNIAGTQPDPVIVRIGGIVCPYDPILPYEPRAAYQSGSGLYQGSDDANGDSFDEIRGVVVPVAAFGAGGTYDVEVINADGQYDIYPNGFTYYADSRPRADASTRFPWRPANFVPATGGERTLLASGLDTGILYRIIDPLADPVAIKWVPSDVVPPVSVITPDQSIAEHLSHTQREVLFNLAGSADGLESGGSSVDFNSNTNQFHLEIDNARDASGKLTWTASGMKTASTAFALAKEASDAADIIDGETLSFSLGEVEMVKGLRAGFVPPTDVADGSPEAAFDARVRVKNYKEGDHIAILGETDITDTLLLGDWLYFNYPAMPEGAYGPQNVALELPDDSEWNKLGLATNVAGDTFPLATYYVSAMPAWRPRLTGTALARPDLRYAEPRTVPETGGVEITLHGADFVGPFVPGADFSVQSLNWDFTRVSVVHDDTNFDPTDQSENIAVLVGPGSNPVVTAYEVVSDSEIRLILADLTAPANPLTDTTLFPRNTPLDLMVEQVDRDGNPVFAADGTTPLRYILHDALVIMGVDTTNSIPLDPPTVTDVYRNDSPGTVGGIVVGLPGTAGNSERDALASALSTLTDIVVASEGTPLEEIDVLITYPGATVDAAAAAWVENGGGVIQIGADGPGIIPVISQGNTTNPLDITLGAVSADPELAKLVAGLPATWTSLAVAGSALHTADTASWPGLPVLPTTAQVLAQADEQAPGSISAPNAFEAAYNIGAGKGRAVFFGWSVYGAGADPNDGALLTNAINWVANPSKLREGQERWGLVTGGDLVVVEGFSFLPTDPATNPTYPAVPTVRFGDVEAWVVTPGDSVALRDPSNPTATISATAPALTPGVGVYNRLYVVTPPALDGKPGLTDVYVTTRQAAGTDRHELTGVTPSDRRFLYIADGTPVIESILPNYISREESDAVDGVFDAANQVEDYIGKDGLYLTFEGINFDDTIQLLLYVDEDPLDDLPDDLNGDGQITIADYLVLDGDSLPEYHTVSPSELLVKAPAAGELVERMVTGTAIPDDPFAAGYGMGAGNNVAGIVRFQARVRNLPLAPDTYDDDGDPDTAPPDYSTDWTVDAIANITDLFTDNVTSNPVAVYYYDEDHLGIEPDIAVLQFNDVYQNQNDYVNVGAGIGSISVDPLLDPGPTTIHAPGPKMVVADAANWWLGKLAQGYSGQNPVRDKAGDFPMPPYSGEDLEMDGRPNGPPADDDAKVIQGAGRAKDAKSEIGADELPLSAYDLEWYYCGILPEVLGRNNEDFEIEIRIRGLAAALNGDTDGSNNTIEISAAERVMILPQGAISDALDRGMSENPNLDDIREYLLPRAIQCELTRLEGDTYLAKPNHTVETVIFRPEGTTGTDGVRLPGGDPLPGDVIADGHAAVFVVIPPNMTQRGDGGDRLLGMSGLVGNIIDDLTDSSRIVDQAVTGRHFLVDTIPPRIFLESTDATGDNVYGLRDSTEPFGPAADVWEFVSPVGGWNDPIDTRFDDIYSFDLTPQSALFDGTQQELHGFPILTQTYPYTDNRSHHYTPADGGLLENIAPTDAQLPGDANGILARLINPVGLLNPPATQRPPLALYFNKASVSNAQNSDTATDNDLSFQVNARFVDPPVAFVPDAFPNLETGTLYTNRVVNEAVAGNVADRDIYTSGLETRQVSGFLDVQLNGLTGRRAVRAIEGTNDDTEDVDAAFEYLGAQWRFEGNSDVELEDAEPEVNITFGVDSMTENDPAWHQDLAGAIRDNMGFNPDFIRGTNPAGGNVLDATWEITNLDWGNAYNLMSAQRAWNLSFSFIARDRAGNTSTLEIEPLRLWWMLQMRTEFVRDPGWDARTNEPVFRWAPIRNYDPNPQYGAFPVYTYTVFVERNEVGVPEDDRHLGPYIQSPEGWQFWSRNAEADTSLFRRTLEAMGLDPEGGEHHMIFVVQGADEAGNVEPWPTKVVDGYGSILNGTIGDDLLPAPDDDLILNFHDTGLYGQTLPQDQIDRMREWVFDDDTTQRKLRNWHRFVWRGVNKPETIVSRIVPTFWYGNVDGGLREGAANNLPDGQTERRLGPNPRIAMPSEGSGLKVEAEFLVESAYSALAADEQLMVAWQLFEDGVRVSPPLGASDPYNYIDPANGGQNPVQLPWFFTFPVYPYAYPDYDGYNTNDRPGDLGDHERTRPVRYTFRAATFVDVLGTGQGSYNSGEKIDPTWENVTFAITPVSSEERVYPGDQPILETDDR